MGALADRPLEQDSKYWLATHVYLCQTDDHVVLLDLKRNEYIGIGCDDARVLAKEVVGWPRIDPEGCLTQEVNEAESPDIIVQLLETGMLTREQSVGKNAAPVKVYPPKAALIEGYAATRIAIGLKEILGIAKAVLKAKWMLRQPTLEKAVTQVRSRHRERYVNNTVFDERRARKRVFEFQRLRPFLTTPRESCLFDSLVLDDFLAGYGIVPQWVFGVATRPFAAHCWLQHGEVVLNDSLENVRRFTPIMAL